MAERMTVSNLNRYVKLKLETDELLRNTWVEGELSNLTVNELSGHAYFSLKDSGALVRAVMFKTAFSRLRFVPKSGMLVLAGCNVSLYERDGQFQLIVNELLPLGEGAQQASLEQLKEKLAAEGFFAAEKKRPLPLFPAVVAVVTSASGAAIRDIETVFGRRWPLTKLLHYNVSVQGLLAEPQIVAAIEDIARQNRADLVIIARGGGSKEDLWVFNSEAIVRAAAALPMPCISAVGHETDYTLLDYASDLRAPTPSAAAELAAPDMRELRAALSGYRAFITQQLCQRLDSRQQAAEDLAARLKTSMAAAVEVRQQRLDLAGQAIDRQIGAALEQREQKLAHLSGLVDSLSPLRVLARGYAAVRAGGGFVSSAGLLKPGDAIEVVFKDGAADCSVIQVKEGANPIE